MMRQVADGESPFYRRLGRAPTSDELLGEVSAVIRDAWRFHTQEGVDPTAALMTAQLASSVRDFERRSIGLGDVATLIAGWLIDRARGVSAKAPLEAAWCAVSGTGAESALALELQDLVDGYATGAINDEDLTTRMSEAREGL